MKRSRFALVLMAIAAVATLVMLSPGQVQADDLCGANVSGHIVLTHDQNCTDVTGGLTVDADGTTIELNGWTINCTEVLGYLGSCQGLGTVGVDLNGHTGVTVTGPGTINGFEIGVLVDGTGANVKDLLVTGPAAPAGSIPNDGVAPFNPRPSGQNAIRVTGIDCPVDFSTSVNIHNNQLENHTEGIVLNFANCVNVHHNITQNNNSDPQECAGIALNNSDNNKIHHNDVIANGENLGFDGGIILRNSDSNKIFQNLVTNNFGAGISLRQGSANNTVDNNQVSGHVLFGGDLSEREGPGPNNSYKGDCFTTTNIVPAPHQQRSVLKKALEHKTT